MNITIRRMTVANLTRVSELDHLSFSLPWPERAFMHELETNKAARCWVAETSVNGVQVIVGMIVVWVIIDEVHIATLAVDPEFRRMKIAQKLLAFTLLDAVQSGATTSFLEVRRGNAAARALYQNFGYVEVGIRKHYYQDNNEDAVMMNLEPIDLPRLESLQ